MTLDTVLEGKNEIKVKLVFVNQITQSKDVSEVDNRHDVFARQQDSKTIVPIKASDLTSVICPPSASEATNHVGSPTGSSLF